MEKIDTILPYTLLRMALGLNIFLHGAIRIMNGTAAFRSFLVKDFERAPLPSAVISVFATVLSPAEIVIGLCLTIGLFTQPFLLTGYILLMVLMIGKCLQSDWNVVALQWIYLLLYLILLVFQSANHFSMDAFLSE